MAINESGHAVNTSNFTQKVNVVNNNLADYKPSNPEILPEALNTLSGKVKLAADNVIVTNTAFTNAIKARQNAYDQMDDLATKSIHMLSSCGATPDQVQQGKSLLAKYNSERVSEEPAEGEPKRSTSQQGFINRLNHFRGLNAFLKTIPQYNPTETELKTDELDKFANSVELLNTARNNALNARDKALDVRNKLMYTEPSGAYSISVKVMSYVAATLGKKSLFYQELQKYPIRKK